MTRRLFVLDSRDKRQFVARLVSSLPRFARVEIKDAKRTLPQNDRFWASLTDVAEQIPWHGVMLSPADWKLIFLDGLKREMRIVPNLDGNGFVNLGRSSSDLTKEEMSDTLELIYAFGAQHGVQFHDADSSEAAPVVSERERRKVA